MSAGTGIGRSLPDTRVAAPDQPSGFLEWFRSFLAQELAPSPRRLRTTLRIALMTMLASGLGSSLQLPDSYAPLTTWRIFSTGSPALGFVELNLLTAVMITSEASSLVLAGILSEAPWLSLAFIFGVATTSTYVVQGLGLKSAWVMIQISFFATFFTIALTPAEAGTSTAYAFAGIALAYAITYLGDNFIWPEHVERDLLDSLGARIERNRRHLEVAGVGYFSLEAAARIKPPPLYTMLATHLALFGKVRKEQPDPRRREILLSAISQGEQIHHAAIVLGYLSQADVPRVMRLKLRDELEAVFAAFDVSLRDRATHTIAGLREGEGEAARRAAWTRLTQALEALRNRTTEGMPDLAATSGAEASNLNSFVRELHRLGQILRRTPEELPPAATYAPPKRDEQMRLAASLGLPQDPQMVRHSVRTGIAVAVAFVVLLIAHRPELSVIIQTVLLVGPPTLGAQVRKSLLRLAGGVVGALIAIPTIMILSPNFDEIGAYLTAIFIAMLIISYLSTSTTRINYAGLQAGISFILAVATLAPSTDVTEPLWRIWGAILGLVIATAVFLIRPEFSGRALAERMPPFLRAVISLIPANDVPPLDEDRLRALQMYTSRAYQEMLSIAEDARLEGYRSGIDHRAVVDAAANLARIGYRLADVTMDRGAWSIEMPAPIVEARDAFENALRRNLEAWLASFERLGTGAPCDIRSAIHPPRYDDLEHAFLALDEIITANHLSEVVELPEAARVALFSDLETYRRITNRARNLDRALRAVVVQSEAVGA